MSLKKMNLAQFQERLLQVMEEKHHWAWPQIIGPSITKTQLKIHYQQEYAVYVRDFPVFLSRIHGKNPPLAVRKMLAENIYEEDTGKLSLGISHPELFLQMMKGLGFSTVEFEQIKLFPATQRYRAWLDEISRRHDWIIGAAVLTIFVEGSVNDRKELGQSPRAKTIRQINRKLDDHPLVKFHGVAKKQMGLIRAHQLVEAGHRHDAYAMVVGNAATRSQQNKVLAALRKTLELWLHYRDAVARSCGLKPM